MRTPKQTITGNITQQTGISQRSLAVFLALDHSLLTHYDKGNRSLPTAALLQLLEMDKHLQQPGPLPAPSISGKEKEALLLKVKECGMKRYRLQAKLEDMQLSQQQAVNTLHLAKELNTTPNALSETKQLWLNLEAHKAAIKLRKKGWLPQRKLEIAIGLLEKEAALYEAMANATL